MLSLSCSGQLSIVLFAALVECAIQKLKINWQGKNKQGVPHIAHTGVRAVAKLTGVLC